MVRNKQSVDKGLEPPPLSSLTDTNPGNGSFPGATWDLKKIMVHILKVQDILM